MADGSVESGGRGLTRREAMKVGLRAGAYAAPALVALAAAPAAAAATPPPPLAQPVAFQQDAALAGAGAGVAFDVYYTASNQPAGTFALLGTFTTDAFGFGGGAYPLSLDTSAVTSVRLTFVLSGKAPTTPAAATFTSALVAGLAPTGAGGQPPASFVGLVVQEPTVAACTPGPPGSFTQTIDVALLNGPANTAYDFYVTPSTTGVAVKVATATTNGRGNATVFARSGAIAMAAAGSAVVTAVPAGGAPTAAAFALTASGGTFTNIGCAALAAAAAPRPIGIVR